MGHSACFSVFFRTTLQALINMGEILKAAGCGYENGTSSSIPYMSVLSCKFSGISSWFFLFFCLQLSRPQYYW